MKWKIFTITWVIIWTKCETRHIERKLNNEVRNTGVDNIDFQLPASTTSTVSRI